MKSIFRLLYFIFLFTLNPLLSNGFAQNPQGKTKALILKATETSDPKISLAYLNNAYQYIYELEDSLEARLYIDLGTTHLALSHIDSANYFLHHGLNIAANNSFSLLEIIAIEKLAEAAKLDNKFEQAANYYASALKKNNQYTLAPLKSNDNTFTHGAIIGLILLIIFLFYLNLWLRKILNQKEEHWKQEFIKSTSASETIETEKFSLPIKALNEHIIHPLSQREYEVLCLVVTSKTNAQIAEALFVSVNTVKTHLKKVFEKLNVTTRTEAIEKVIAIKKS